MLNRRQTIATIAATAGAAVFSPKTVAAPKPTDFIPCLNMSTLRGHKLGFVKELETASKAGFRSVEIWMDSLQEYLQKGGTIADAQKRLKDLGLTVQQAIGFAQWVVDDNATRAAALEQLKREMELLASLGCKRMAAPPAGAQQIANFDLRKAAERYRAILDLSDQTGVVPHLELWGFSKSFSRLSEVMYIAVETGHPSARLLLDVYHLYKGGSSLDSLSLVGKSAIELFHINDYPANPPRETNNDSDRVHVGDGIAPVKRILEVIKRPDRPIILSLELFNKTYYEQAPLQVARTGLEKIKAVLR
ncbi:MAG: sugar phosphate isomerase/epimerase family protein [Runella sp.]